MNRRHVTLLLALLLLLAVGAGAGLWWRARESTARIAEAIPENPNLGTLPTELGRRIDAAEDVARGGPDRRDALAELSRLYHANGFYPEAVQCYRGLMQVDGGNAQWPHLMADIVASYGQLEDALALWGQTLELDDSYLPAHLRRGDALLKLNRFDEARNAYEQALAVEPNDPYAWFGLGRLAVKAERWSEAKGYLERATQGSNLNVGLDLLVTAYEKLGASVQADELRGRAKAWGAYFDPPDAWVNAVYEDCYDSYRLSLVAGAAQRAGDRPTGERLLRRALSLAPESAPIQYQMGLLLAAKEDDRGALKFFDQCVKLDATFSDGWVQLVETYKKLGQTDAADRAVATGLAYCPNSPALHLERGRRLSAAQRYDEALAELRTTIELRPEEAEPYVEAAKIYFQMDRGADGAEELKRALKAEPGNPVAVSTLVVYAISTGNEEMAKEWLREVRLRPRVVPERRQQLEKMYQDRFGHAPPR